MLKQHHAATDAHGQCCQKQTFTRFTRQEEIVPLTNFCLTPNLILNEGGKLAEKRQTPPHSIFRFPLRHPIEHLGDRVNTKENVLCEEGKEKRKGRCCWRSTNIAFEVDDGPLRCPQHFRGDWKRKKDGGMMTRPGKLDTAGCLGCDQ